VNAGSVFSVARFESMSDSLTQIFAGGRGFLQVIGGAGVNSWTVGAGATDGLAFTPTSNVNTGTPALVLTQAGNVGIGTTNPAFKLNIVGSTGYTQVDQAVFGISDSTDSTKRLVIGVDPTTPDANGAAFIRSAKVGTGATPLLLQPTGGNVGIGTTDPQAALDVNGAMRLAKNPAEPFACVAAKDGAIALTSQYTTCVCKGGSSAWVLTSNGTTTCTW
jgi:hypothetical protein